ncbi:hypothetical protein D3C76_1695420 [compost metagenome]
MCTVKIATSIVITKSAAPSGVNSPAAKSKPPPNSDNPAIIAIGTPGLTPMDSIQPPVPFGP